MMWAFQRVHLLLKTVKQILSFPFVSCQPYNGAVSRQEINRQYADSLLHIVLKRQTQRWFFSTPCPFYKPVPPAPFRQLGDVTTVFWSNMINRPEKTPLPSIVGAVWILGTLPNSSGEQTLQFFAKSLRFPPKSGDSAHPPGFTCEAAVHFRTVILLQLRVH